MRQDDRSFVPVRRFIAFGITIIVVFSALTARLYDLEIVRELSGEGVTVWWADPRGAVQSVVEI